MSETPIWRLRQISRDQHRFRVRREGYYTQFQRGGRWIYTPPRSHGVPRVLPPPTQLANPPSFRGTMRNPVLNMRPDGTFDIMGRRRGQSVPRVPFRGGRPPKPLQRGLARIGLRAAAQAHPYTRLAKLALDMIDLDHDSLPWGIVKPGVPENQHGYDFGPEWQPCDNNQSLSQPAGNTCFFPYTRFDSAQNLPCHLNGTDLHVPSGAYGSTIGANIRSAAFGYGMANCQRMAYQQIFNRTSTGDPVPFIGPQPAQPPVVARVPTAVPPPAVQADVSLGPHIWGRASRVRPRKSNPHNRWQPSYQDRYAARYNKRPFYSTAAISIPITSGGFIPPDHTNPHNRLPPGRNERERKAKITGREAYKFLAALYEGTVFARDIINVLYRRLGKKCPGAVSMSAKAHCIYSNIHTLDVRNAALDLAYLHFVRKIAGRIFEPLGKHTPYGTMQSRAREDLSHEIQRAVREREKEERK